MFLLFPTRRSMSRSNGLVLLLFLCRYFRLVAVAF